MELSEQERETMVGNCLASSWQQALAWRLRQNGAVGDTPAALLDWLLQADPCTHMALEVLLSHLESHLWWVQPGELKVGDMRTRRLHIHCGAQRWTVWQQAWPLNGVLRITR